MKAELHETEPVPAQAGRLNWRRVVAVTWGWRQSKRAKMSIMGFFCRLTDQMLRKPGYTAWPQLQLPYPRAYMGKELTYTSLTPTIRFVPHCSSCFQSP